MHSSYASWVVLVLAAALANTPFITRRVLFFFSVKKNKSFRVHLFELLIFYILLGVFAWITENALGNAASQGWEFFAITAAVFLTLAFPGFVYRYLTSHPATPH